MSLLQGAPNRATRSPADCRSQGGPVAADLTGAGRRSDAGPIALRSRDSRAKPSPPAGPGKLNTVDLRPTLPPAALSGMP